MTRIVGQKGSRRRRWLVPWCLVIVFSAAAFYISGASAVHDYGVFQLDGNATTASDPNGFGGDDWDKICTPVAGGCIGGASSNLTAKTFDQDGAQNATIYVGGGSKDDIDIDQWQWKDELGGLPDKDNLQQAYSARYAYSTTLTSGVTAAATCFPVANVNFFPAVLPGHSYDASIGSEIVLVTGKGVAAGCLANELKVVRGDAGTTAAAHSSGDVLLVSLLYFGATRFDNSGDAQIGFWFLQGQVGTQTGKKNTFGPDKHTVGDLLVLSDFTGGGTQPTIRAFRWVGSGGDLGTLQSISDPSAPVASCISVPTASPPITAVGNGDPFCAVVNPGDGVTSPWTFLNKDGTANFNHGEFYEGGLNLSAFPGLAGECFGSFLSETRSSQSVSAVLKDFILGPLASCEAGINTVPSPTSIVLNGTGTQTTTDTATVTGVGTLTPTGTVQFFFCTPTQMAALNETTCATGGTAVGNANGEPLSQSSPGVATATSAASPAITTVGTYCWRGVYVPAQGSPYKSVTDSDTSECLNVTDTSSVISAQTWVPNDSATASATGGTPLNGTLATELHESNDCSGTAVTGQSYSKTLTDASTLAARTLTTTNTTYSVSATKTVSWLVTFTSTNNNVTSATSHCEVSSLTITN